MVCDVFAATFGGLSGYTHFIGTMALQCRGTAACSHALRRHALLARERFETSGTGHPLTSGLGPVPSLNRSAFPLRECTRGARRRTAEMHEDYTHPGRNPVTPITLGVHFRGDRNALIQNVFRHPERVGKDRPPPHITRPLQVPVRAKDLK